MDVQHSGQSDPMKRSRSCPSSAPSPPMVLHLTGSNSHGPHLTLRAVTGLTRPLTSSANTPPRSPSPATPSPRCAAHCPLGTQARAPALSSVWDALCLPRCLRGSSSPLLQVFDSNIPAPGEMCRLPVQGLDAPIPFPASRVLPCVDLMSLLPLILFTVCHPSWNMS